MSNQTEFPCRNILPETNDFCDGKLETVSIVSVDYGAKLIEACAEPLGSPKREAIFKEMEKMVYGRLYRCPKCTYMEDYDDNEVRPK